MEVEELLGVGAVLVQLFGDHVPDLVHQLGEVAQAVIHLVECLLVEVVVRRDVQVQFEGITGELVRSHVTVFPPVVELDFPKMFARYLAHVFKIVPNKRRVPASWKISGTRFGR